jgi:hypothetical protein
MKNCIKNWLVIDIVLLKDIVNNEDFDKEFEYFLDAHGDNGQGFIYDMEFEEFPLINSILKDLSNGSNWVMIWVSY